ncbi:MAG: hypothetical protein AXW12_00635 [Thalassospira sp. Nap_22]|nr:MAG: hypothetical protein AXW12_00635 [Thalassospira sp. Nap_22]
MTDVNKAEGWASGNVAEFLSAIECVDHGHIPDGAVLVMKCRKSDGHWALVLPGDLQGMVGEIERLQYENERMHEVLSRASFGHFERMVDAICMQRGLDPDEEQPMQMEDTADGRLQFITKTMDMPNWIIVQKEVWVGLRELTEMNRKAGA